MEIAKLAATATMSSREIATLTGKDVAHIHRDIRTMIAQLEGDPELDHVREDKDDRGYTTCFHLPKGLSITLVAGYSTKLRKAIIDRWQALEDKAKTPPLPESYIQALECLLVSKKAEQAAIEQRDEAIRTKAMIGSKREATAMATAGAAKRESARLKEALGASARHATVRAVHGVTKTEYHWLPMRHWCKREQIAPVAVVDPLYGEVKAWPAGAWMDCHDVDLRKLFGEV